MSKPAPVSTKQTAGSPSTQPKVKPVRAAAKGRSSPRRKVGRGALGLIAGLLIASGIIRISDGVGRVMALEITPAGSSTAPLADCTPDAGTAALLAALQDREAKLKVNETAIGERRQALSVAESKISARLTELKDAEAELSGTLARADKASENDLAKLTTVYENMKPKDAALLFSVMEPDFAAGFLARMRPEAAAGVMAGLDPKTAYAVSAVLAGRNATVPKE